jgi:hypothetical protein
MLVVSHTRTWNLLLDLNILEADLVI